MHKKLQGKLGGLAICICLVSMICSEGLAAQFQWYNDPNSTTDFTFFSRSCAQTASDPCTNNIIRLADPVVVQTEGLLTGAVLEYRRFAKLVLRQLHRGDRRRRD